MVAGNEKSKTKVRRKKRRKFDFSDILVVYLAAKKAFPGVIPMSKK